MSNRIRINSDKMYLQVLGCSSARPIVGRHPSSHVLRLRGKVFLIDCGEGTQVQLLRYGVPVGDLHRIFITHLHGDHVLGLPGLLTTLSLVGFNHPYHIYGPEGIEDFVKQVVGFFTPEELGENIFVHEITFPDPENQVAEIYSDKSISVTAFPLLHRGIPCVGYRFEEAPLSPHLDREMADFYEIPVHFFNRLKAGEDFVKADGTIVPASLVTKPNRPPYSFAFCSDTSYNPRVIPHIYRVSLLYHEATYMEEESLNAHQRGHSTAREAAEIAKRARVGTLLLGHFSTRYKTDNSLEELLAEAKEVFPLTLLAREGMVIDFGELENKQSGEDAERGRALSSEERER